MDRLVNIELLGQNYKLRTSAEEDQVLAAANLVRTKLDEYQAASPTNVKLNVAVLAALDLANEFIKLERNNQNDCSKWEDRIREIITRIEARL